MTTLAAPLLVALSTQFSSSPVELPHLPGSQSPGLVGARPLTVPLRVSGRDIAFELERDRLRVATAPGLAPKQRLREEGTVLLRWSEDDEELERCLRFERDHEGAWHFGPARARRFEIGGEALFLVDGDLDGEYDDLTSDGWSREAGGPLLPLAREVVVGTRRLALGEIASDGTSLEARVGVVAGTVAQLTALRRLNDLRAAAGLPGVDLDSELSLGCSEHARYLLESEWDGAMQVNDQDPGAPATSRAGRAAAQHGFMVAATPRAAIELAWLDPRGRALLLAPDLVRVGLSDDVGTAWVVDARSRGTHRSDPTLRWAAELLAPCDRGLEAHASVPPPLLVRHGASEPLEAYAGRLWRVDGREPRAVEVEVLEGLTALGCAGVRPLRKLARGGRYLVVHELTRGGELTVRRAVFRCE